MSPKHTIYCLGEVLLALDADAPLAHAESFRPRLGGDAAVLAQACAAQGGCSSLLAQLGADPFGHRAASTLAAAGVDTTHMRFSRTLPTALLFEAGRRGALLPRAHRRAAVCPGAAGAGALPARGRPALCLLRPMRQPAAVHPFSGPHRRPGCRGPDLLCALPGACPLAPAGRGSGPAGGHPAAAPPGRHCPSHHGRAGIFVRHSGDAGGAFPSLAGAHPAGAFGLRRGHPRLYPHEPCILAGALPPRPAAGRQGALLFAAKKQHAGKTAPPHHQAVTNDLIRNAQSPRRPAGALLRKVSNSEKIVGCLVSG